MVNTKIRFIMFFAAKDGEALYSQQNQYWVLTVAQIMNSLLPNSDSFVDCESYSISSKAFLSTVVDIIVILVKFTHSGPF